MVEFQPIWTICSSNFFTPRRTNRKGGKALETTWFRAGNIENMRTSNWISLSTEGMKINNIWVATTQANVDAPHIHQARNQFLFRKNKRDPISWLKINQSIYNYTEINNNIIIQSLKNTKRTKMTITKQTELLYILREIISLSLISPKQMAFHLVINWAFQDQEAQIHWTRFGGQNHPCGWLGCWMS